VDYAYAGDLKGNLWKFDLTDSDPAIWGVAFGEDINDDGSINFSEGDAPEPLFQAVNQPITTKPDVIRHCESHGFIVVFGTGKFLSIDDRSNVEIQTLYGIWDYGDDEDDSEFLGSYDRTNRTLSNQPDNVTLLQQIVIDFSIISGVEFRALSARTPIWATIEDTDEGQNPNPGSDACSDGVNNDGDDETDEADECIAHVGWYFDLPSDGERIIKDLLIREGRAIVLSLIPTDSPCSHGGNSFLYEIDACTGGRLLFPLFDIDYNLAVDNRDRISISAVGEEVPPSGIGFTGILNPPSIIGGPGETEIKLFSSSSGAIEKVVEVGEKKGIYYWIER
jgi:Tfp pilus tip-associated adhesin PilY1